MKRRAGPAVSGVLQGIVYGVCMEYFPPLDDHEPPSLRGCIVSAVFMGACLVALNLWLEERDPDRWGRVDDRLWFAGFLAVIFGVGYVTRLAEGQQSYFWIPALIATVVLAVLIRRRRKEPVDVA
jgi:MFS family permease